MRKAFLLFLYFTIPSLFFAQQTGELKGVVTETDGTPIPFANVVVEKNNLMITGQAADIDGNFWIKNLPVDSYTIKIASAGLPTLIFKQVYIKENQVTYLYPKLKAEVTMCEYTITTSKIKLDPGNTVDGGTYSRKDITNNPSTTNLGIVNVTAGVYTRDGDVGNFAGSRQGATVFIDGVKVRGSNTTITGGIPAKYGDVNQMQQDQLKIDQNLIDKTIIIDDTEPILNEEYSSIVENIFESPISTPLSTFSVDVDKASYSNIRRMIKDGNLPTKNSIRLEEMINYFTYQYPQPTDEHPFSINLESAICPWDTNHQIISVGLQGKIYSAEELPPANLVFLIDVSGSMSDINKLPLVKSSLRALVNQLRDIDKVSMVVYAGAAGLVLPPTSGKNKTDILNAIDQLSAGGSTAGGAGITLAYDLAEKNLVKDGNNRIILCTDGDFNVGVNSESDLENLIVSKRDKGIYLTVLGYGTGNYKDSKMEILADKGNGNYAYIDSQLEADKVLVQEMSGTLYTIAKDVKIQIEFNPAIVKTYRLLGYENRLLEDWEFNDDTRDAGEIGAGHSVTAIYEVEYATLPQVLIEDSLKYQTKMVNKGFDQEALTVKFRYKKPMESTSILMTKTLDKSDQPFKSASENLRFAATVAEFGMILRNSTYKGTASLEMVLDQAKNCKKFDEEGHRAEFINLVKATKSLVSSSKDKN